MQAWLIRYEHKPIAMRLLALTSTTVVVNGLYCLAYRYASGDPATILEALSWGAINLAPWIAAIEIGRHMRHARQIVPLMIGAAALSLLLGAAVRQELPDLFELLRRLPGLAFTLLALAAIELARRVRARQAQADERIAVQIACDWVRAAGNYVELHAAGRKPRLVRAGIGAVVTQQSPPLLRIHRSYAVAPAAIARIERNHVLTVDGLRLPIGDRYRAQLPG